MRAMMALMGNTAKGRKVRVLTWVDIISVRVHYVFSVAIPINIINQHGVTSNRPLLSGLMSCCFVEWVRYTSKVLEVVGNFWSKFCQNLLSLLNVAFISNRCLLWRKWQNLPGAGVQIRGGGIQWQDKRPKRDSSGHEQLCKLFLSSYKQHLTTTFIGRMTSIGLVLGWSQTPGPKSSFESCVSVIRFVAFAFSNRLEAYSILHTVFIKCSTVMYSII